MTEKEFKTYKKLYKQYGCNSMLLYFRDFDELLKEFESTPDGLYIRYEGVFLPKSVCTAFKDGAPIAYLSATRTFFRIHSQWVPKEFVQKIVPPMPILNYV
jgi:hypothetical protein